MNVSLLVYLNATNYMIFGDLKRHNFLVEAVVQADHRRAVLQQQGSTKRGIK